MNQPETHVEQLEGTSQFVDRLCTIRSGYSDDSGGFALNKTKNGYRLGMRRDAKRPGPLVKRVKVCGVHCWALTDAGREFLGLGPTPKSPLAKLDALAISRVTNVKVKKRLLNFLDLQADVIFPLEEQGMVIDPGVFSKMRVYLRDDDRVSILIPERAIPTSFDPFALLRRQRDRLLRIAEIDSDHARFVKENLALTFISPTPARAERIMDALERFPRSVTEKRLPVPNEAVAAYSTSLLMLGWGRRKKRGGDK